MCEYSEPYSSNEPFKETSKKSSLQLLIDCISPNRKLKKKLVKECIICLNRPKEYCIKHCGHYCLCKVCKNGLKKCPICRIKINKNSFIKIYDV